MLPGNSLGRDNRHKDRGQSRLHTFQDCVERNRQTRPYSQAVLLDAGMTSVARLKVIRLTTIGAMRQLHFAASEENSSALGVAIWTGAITAIQALSVSRFGVCHRCLHV